MKCNDPDFLRQTDGCEIIALTETHSSSDTDIAVPDYITISKSRPKSSRAPKHSGGISALIRQDIRDGVTQITSTSSDLLWLKLKKDFFQNEHDIFIGIVYIPPKNSTYSSKLENPIYDILNVI